MAAPAIVRAASAGAALLLALCAGAVWSVVALIVPGEAAWMALPTVITIVYALAYLKHATRGARIGSALVLYAIAVAYAHYLNAASVISAQLGLDFLDTLRRVGPEMAFALTTARGRAADAATIAAGAVVLVAIAARYPPRNGKV